MSAATFANAAVPGCVVCRRHCSTMHMAEIGVVKAARYRASAWTAAMEARGDSRIVSAKAHLGNQCDGMSDHLRAEHDISLEVAA